MSTFVATDVNPYVGALDLAALSEAVSMGDLTAAAVSVTNFASGGYVENRPGVISGEFTVNLLQDFALLSADDVLGTAAFGAQYAITLAPNPGNTNAAGDVAYLSRGYAGKRSPMAGSFGEVAKSAITLPYDARVTRGALLHPKAARTATGSGTAVALTGPTATQSLYATLHVLAYTGFTNVVVKVQSDNAVGFPSATDRITFTTTTGTGSQYATVAGDFSTETHVRAQWTVTGTGSITFVVAAGVF